MSDVGQKPRRSHDVPSVLTTEAPDNLAQYLAMRYSLGSVCGTSANEITDAVALILAQPDPGISSSTDSWIAEYSWDTMVYRIVNIYGSDTTALVPVATEFA